MQRFLILLLMVGGLGTAFVGPCKAQPPSVVHSVVPSGMAFDTATVRQRPTPVANASLFPLGADDAFVQTGGRFKATNNLLHFIAFAYRLQPRQMKQMAHEAPKWVSATAFEIDARTSRASVTKDEMRLMMQSLLADKFHLELHREVQQITIFGLTVVEPRAANRELKPHVDKRNCAKKSSNACRGVITSLDDVQCLDCKKIRAEGLSMAQFVAFLMKQPRVGTVIDRTGLAGIYDFGFEWDPIADANRMPDLLPGDTAPPVPAGASVVGGDETLDYVPERSSKLDKALKEQLGLALVPEASQAEFYVIDRVQNPE